MLILALGGHEFSRRRGNEALRDYMLGLVETERPRSACCRRRAVTRGNRSPPSASRWGAWTARCRISPCSGSRAGAPRSASISCGRTSSTSAAAAWSTCSPSGAPTASIAFSARRGERDGALRSERGGDVLVRVGHHALHGSGPPRARSRPASRKPVRPPSPRPRPPAGPAPGRLACDSARLRSRRPSGAAVPGRRAGGTGQRQARGGGVAGRERRRGRLDGDAAGSPAARRPAPAIDEPDAHVAELRRTVAARSGARRRG